MTSERGKVFEHFRLWSILILFACLIVAAGTAAIVAPGDIIPVNVSGFPSNIAVVNVPFLDVILRNFFIEPIIHNIPLLSPSAANVLDPNDIISKTIPFPFR
jgi:hypothetical protein